MYKERNSRERTNKERTNKERTKIFGLKKSCVFCKKESDINYKNIELLSRYVSSKGKIMSRRSSGNCAKHQRRIAKEIKLARFLSLLPYLAK
ncbi:MAG: 30S ribosomal protein S18 [Candidatus Omnitrophota bacterium]|nr:30S ribosomal protein S18 [Candidatus Omnitrophota bacterium]